jgi:hypothetical protein
MMKVTHIRLFRNHPDGARMIPKIYAKENQENAWSVAHDLNGNTKVSHFDTLSSAKNFRKGLIKKRDKANV